MAAKANPTAVVARNRARITSKLFTGFERLNSEGQDPNEIRDQIEVGSLKRFLITNNGAEYEADGEPNNQEGNCLYLPGYRCAKEQFVPTPDGYRYQDEKKETKQQKGDPGRWKEKDWKCNQKTRDNPTDAQ